MFETLAIHRDGPVFKLTLNRPEVKNAMSARMVRELTEVFTALAEDRTVRVVVLRGAGGTFCAGADLKDMANAAQKPDAATLQANNRRFGAMLERADTLPQAVVALVEGAAMGGGFGLACIADWTIAEKDARFAMPETSLGILPAQIAPFVVARIGFTQARRLGVSGARIEGTEAVRIGLAHELAEGAEDLAAKGLFAVNQCLRCAPDAVAATKLLMRAAQREDLGRVLDGAAAAFVAAVSSEEGREGTRAFVEKRRPAWSASLDKL